MHILVVEDERILCETIARSLKRLAYSVDCCYDGITAMQMLADDNFDLVVLDLNLPDADGMTVLRTLRKTDRDTKVLILSARSEVSDKVDGLDAGANDYLAKPFHYRTTDGFDIFAGKNNLQNDLLTLKIAFKSDIWFHTQKIHGSHVILVTDGREPTEQAMTEAAMIAAYHSKARLSSMVPVDYTQVRQVKKPAGAKPGMVIYHVYQTAYVTPDETVIEKLRIE